MTKFNLNELILDLKRSKITEVDIDGQFVEIYLEDQSNEDIQQVVLVRHQQLKNFLIAHYADRISQYIKRDEFFDLSVSSFYEFGMITPKALEEFLIKVGKVAQLSIEQFLCLEEGQKNAYLYNCHENVDHYERPTYINKVLQYIYMDTVDTIPLFHPKLFEWAKARRIARLRKEKFKTELQTAKAI